MARKRLGARQRWVLLAILLLGFGLRLWRLGAESLWYDETVTVHLASKSIPELWAHTAGDIHPPGYYLLLHAWTRLTRGASLAARDFAVAFPSVFFGLLLVVLAFWLSRKIFGPRTSVLTALLVAVSPYNLWYSQEVRMYTLGAALGMGLLGTVLSLTIRQRWRAPSLRWLATYAVCGALGLWVLYYFAFLLVAVNALVGAWYLWAWSCRKAPRRRLVIWLGRWSLAQSVVALLYVPWIPIAWRQATSPPVPPWRSFTPLGQVLVETWSALSLGQSTQPARVWPILVVVAVVFAAGLLTGSGEVRIRRTKRRRSGWPRAADPGGFLRIGRSDRSSSAGERRIWHSTRSDDRGISWFLAGAVCLPVLLIYLASLLTPLYHVRYVFTYSTPFYLILGAGLVALGRWWRPLLWVTLAVMFIGFGLSIHAYHTDPELTSDDHRAAVSLLSDRWRPGDAILVNAGYVYTALESYWQGDPLAWSGRLVSRPGAGLAEQPTGGPVVLLTGTVDGDPGLGWGDPRSDFYAMDWDEAEAALDRLFGVFHRVWIYRCYDTVTDAEGAIREWLARNGTLFEDQVFGGEAQLRVQGFLTGRDPSAGAVGVAGNAIVTEPVDLSMADGSLRLVGKALDRSAVPVGGSLDLVLVWHVSGSSAIPEPILFVGLLDDDGRRWAQIDEQPLGSQLPRSGWPAGSTLRTPLRLWVPAGTPPGPYRLEAGWYHFVEGLPAWLPWASGERLSLGEVEVTPPADWWALPPPPLDLEIGLEVGDGVRLLGLEAAGLEAFPGQEVELTLYWQALRAEPEPGQSVLELTDEAGTVRAEVQAAPAGGRAPFSGLGAGQVARDPRSVAMPTDLEPGVYHLSVGRVAPDGAWLPVRRGPFRLGTLVPLATIRVPGRPVDLSPPDVEVPLRVRFGDVIRLVGVDLMPGSVTVHWQALAPMSTRYKVFLHVVGDGGPDDIRAQTDIFPHLPTTAWQVDEYLSDQVFYELPPECAPARCTLLLGLYDEPTGVRLPVWGAGGEPLGDSVVLVPPGIVP